MAETIVCDLLEELSQHERWLRTTLYSRLGSHDEVDEVMQEVALAAANQASRNEPVERVGPWLYRVALRQVMMFRRKAGRHRKLIESAKQCLRSDAVDSKSQGSPLQFLLSQERQSRLRWAMGQMHVVDRQLLMFKYVDGLSYSEIAERIGATASAVQSRLHRARTALREILGNEYYD